MNGSGSMVLQGFGHLLGCLPQVQELVELRQSLAEESDREVVRARILEGAQKRGLSLLSMLSADAAKLPEEAMAYPARQAAQMFLVGLLERIPEDMTMGDALDRLSRWAGWDDFLVDYIEEYALTGKPPGFDDRIVGGVVPLNVTIPGSDGERMPLVTAVVTKWTPMDELIADLREARREAFKDVALTEPQTAAEVGRYWYLRKQRDMSNEEIAWLFLGERKPEIAAADDETREADYMSEHGTEMSRLHQLSTRSTDRLTQIGPQVSADTE